MIANISINLRHGEPDVELRRHGGHQWIEISVPNSRVSVAVHGTPTELAEFAAAISQVAGSAAAAIRAAERFER